MTLGENPKNFSIVVIKWIDSSAPMDSGWQEVDDVADIKFNPLEVHSIGYLLDANDQRIVICNSYFQQDPPSTSISCLGLISIPRVSAISLDYIYEVPSGNHENDLDDVT